MSNHLCKADIKWCTLRSRFALYEYNWSIFQEIQALEDDVEWRALFDDP